MKSYPSYKDSSLPIDQPGIRKIPEHWENWKISHAYKEIGSGTTPKTDNNDYYDEGIINWVNTGDLNNDVLYDCKKQITLKALEDYSVLKVYPPGSLVIAMYGATIGKTSILNIEAATNQACCVLSKSSIIKNRFTFYWFIANKRHIISMSFGGGQPNISQNLIKNLRIAIP